MDNSAAGGYPVPSTFATCCAINAIDASALESLETVEHRLREAGISRHLSEVKGPVIDRLKHTDFLNTLSGQVFLTHYQAVAALTPEVTVMPTALEQPLNT